MATLMVRDEANPGHVVHEFQLDFLTERVTILELIRSRVYQEVEDYNLKKNGEFRGLVAPTEAEKTLNGFKVRPGRVLDWKIQFEAAVEAFKRGHVLILADDKQVTSLDQEIVIGPKSHVTFLKLVPLIGG